MRVQIRDAAHRTARPTASASASWRRSWSARSRIPSTSRTRTPVDCRRRTTRPTRTRPVRTAAAGITQPERRVALVGVAGGPEVARRLARRAARHAHQPPVVEAIVAAAGKRRGVDQAAPAHVAEDRWRACRRTSSQRSTALRRRRRMRRGLCRRERLHREHERTTHQEFADHGSASFNGCAWWRA